MRIALIAHLSEVSGAGIALLDTALAFRDAGHTTYLILPGHGELAQRARDRGVDVVIFPNPEVALADASMKVKLRLVSGRFGYIRQVRRFLANRRIDVAYVNSSASVFAGLAAKLSRAAIVWHIHETLDQDDHRTRIKKRIISRLANRLVYASNSAMDCFPPGAIPAMIARNAIDVQTMATVRRRRDDLGTQNPDKAASDSGSRPVALLNGTIRRKGADLLLHAIRQLQDEGILLNVIITGSPETDAEFYAELLQLRVSLGLSDQVSFPGIQQSLAGMFEKTDVYVSASRNEAMPIAIVEAMAAGVPVIATDVGDCADLLDHGRCGWVVPAEDVEALSRAIRDVIEQPDEVCRRTAAAAEKVDALYGAEDFWQPLIEFVASVAPK